MRYIYQGDTIPVAEYVMTANKLPGEKLERTNDRLAVIPFRSWGKITVEEKSKKEFEVISYQYSGISTFVLNYSLRSLWRIPGDLMEY